MVLGITAIESRKGISTLHSHETVFELKIDEVKVFLSQSLSCLFSGALVVGGRTFI
jgi:hypothetical protein